jgi:hypothetical protein
MLLLRANPSAFPGCAARGRCVNNCPDYLENGLLPRGSTRFAYEVVAKSSLLLERAMGIEPIAVHG